jgi:hypothetical protein
VSGEIFGLNWSRSECSKSNRLHVVIFWFSFMNFEVCYLDFPKMMGISPKVLNSYGAQRAWPVWAFPELVSPIQCGRGPTGPPRCGWYIKILDNKRAYYELARSSFFGAYFESWVQILGPPLSISQTLRGFWILKRVFAWDPLS